MKKKRYLLGLTAAALAFMSLSSCGDSNDNSKKDTDTTESKSQEESTASESTETESTETESTEIDDGLPYEKVRYTLNVEGLETGVLTEEKKINIFSIQPNIEIGNRIREFEDEDGKHSWTKAFCLDSSGESVKVTVPRSYKNGKTYEDGKFVLYIINGSSNAKTGLISIKNVYDGEITNYEFAGTDGGSPLCRVEIPISSDYTSLKSDEKREFEIFYAGGKPWIYEMYYETTLEKGVVNGYQIADYGTTDFLQGMPYNQSDMIIQQTYTNGKIKDLKITNKDIQFDTTQYDPTTPGTYDIKVKYKDYDWTTYQVTVWEPKSMDLGFNKTYLGPSSSAKNSQYINGKVKTIYRPGDVFDDSFLSATISAEYAGQTKSFLLDEKSLICSGYSENTLGEQIITVAYDGADIKSTYSIYMISAAIPYATENGKTIYKTEVDDDYTGEIGEVYNGYMHFKTIGQALEILETLGYTTDSDTYDSYKLIDIKAGYYNEKLEIRVPNLIMNGEGMCKSTHSEDLAANWDKIAFEESTVIEWNSLYGIKDEGGYEQVTDSCQTVAVRDTAFNCTMNNLTLSNYWNCEGIFDKHFGAKYSEHRALALLCQSDQFSMYNCSLLGYQDTLEVFYGRQYFENCYVTGCTDFIFGTNATALFESCEIHVIYKSNASAYITAMKGNNKSADDAVKYGIVFDYCNFIADEGVANGSTSIGRTWGSYAAVMTMNSKLGAHISTQTYADSSVKYYRYLSMNCMPTEDTVKYTEYNNSGDAAMTTGAGSKQGFTYLTKNEADNYNNEAVIFGTSNGGVTYEKAWVRQNDPFYGYNSK